MVTPLWIGRPRRQENQQPASTLYHTPNSHAIAPHIYTRPPHAFSPFLPSLFSSPSRFCHYAGHSSLTPRRAILTVGENLRGAHDRPCHQYRDHFYGDCNAFLQVNCKLHEILNPTYTGELPVTLADTTSCQVCAQQ
jgi:hypothetical protein